MLRAGGSSAGYRWPDLLVAATTVSLVLGQDTLCPAPQSHPRLPSSLFSLQFQATPDPAATESFSKPSSGRVPCTECFSSSLLPRRDLARHSGLPRLSFPLSFSLTSALCDLRSTQPEPRIGSPTVCRDAHPPQRPIQTASAGGSHSTAFFSGSHGAWLLSLRSRPVWTYLCAFGATTALFPKGPPGQGGATQNSGNP